MADSNVGRSDEPMRESPADVSAQIAGAPARSAAYGSSRFSVSLHASQQVVDLTPGQAAMVEVLLANHGPFPDTLTLEVDGPPGEWITLAQQIVPIDAGMQLAIPLVVAVPEGSMGRAGVYLVTLRAFSGVRPGEYSEARTCWIVRTVAAAQLSVTPQQQSDRREAVYTLSITNLGNAPASYILSAEDDQQALDISLDQPMVLVEPARTLHTPLNVSAGTSRLVKTAHTITVRAEAPGLATQAVRARFIQEPLIPLWVPAAGLLALVLLLCLLGRLPVALAGDLPFFSALVALPVSTTPAALAAAFGDLATVQADAQRTSVAIQSTLAAVETTVAVTPAAERQRVETAVAGAMAAQHTLETTVANMPAIAQIAAQAAVSTLLPHLPASGPGSGPAAPTTTVRPAAVPQASPNPIVPTQPPAVPTAAQNQPTDTLITPTPVPATQALTPSQTATATSTVTPTPTPLPGIAIEDASVIEGNSGSTTLLFNLTLSPSSAGIVTVDYSTSDGTAHSPLDYIAASGTVTFEPNVLSKQISLTVIGNTKVDGDRVFTVVLTNQAQAQIAKGRAVGTIFDDDQVITFDPLPNKKVSDPPFTLSASASSGLPVSFVANGSCTVSGATVTLTGAGQCTITASQPGSALFSPAPPVSQTFTINP